MDKKIAGLLGAVAGLATLSAAQAAPAPTVATEPMQAMSYADLLAPVANAAELLKADDAVRAQEAAQSSADLQVAQAYYPYPNPPPPYAYSRYYHHHHHHHHHHRYVRRPHHHHHHGAFVGVPGVGGVVINR
jgi:hypothetical protein